MLTRLALAAAIAALAACASMAKGNRCAPIDPELSADYGGLYDECTVDQSARIIGTPVIDYPYTAPRNVVCVIGVLRFVVDTTGKPIPRTVEVAAGNDQRYVELMISHLPQLRFAPGRIKGRAVHQLSRWESRKSLRVPTSVTGRTSATRSDPSC
jgi:hypothetical protein